MVSDYDVTKGYSGFQEYQGSPREENIDGEPRVFRTYVGPAASRDAFLRYMFGAIGYFFPPVQIFCAVECNAPKRYPYKIWTCQKIIDGVLYSQGQAVRYALRPFSYRCEPWDSERSHLMTTAATIGDSVEDVVPDVDCLVLIEIEYRVASELWPPDIHDNTFESTINTEHSRYLPDVPFIESPTTFSIEHEYAIENRLLEGRKMEVVSFGDQANKYPSTAAGENINDFTHDDILPFTIVNMHTFNVTMHNVPTTHDFRQIWGHLNNDVWFGYPAHAVFCSEVSSKEKYWVDGNIYYDVTFTFVARWVDARGEQTGWVTPVPGPNTGTWVHNGKVGVWNRGWWEFPIPGSKNHWWPIIRSGQSNPGANKVYATDDNLVPDINFHLGFAWWEDLCTGVG